MHWKIKAIFQKILSATTIGDRLNHIPSTLNKNYHYNVSIYQTHETIKKLNYTNINLSTHKTALEIGTGYTIISCIVLSLLGFQKIITVDITRDLKFSNLKKQIHFLSFPEILPLICSNSIFTKKELIVKIETLKNIESLVLLLKQLNIEYIAPYTFKTILDHATKFDYISSQVVLEHMTPKQLDNLFKITKLALPNGGYCVHTINFIDHFANPGFFQDKSISEFNFLKYSNKYWKYWAGNPIAFTNRLSYIYYLELCKKHGFKAYNFIGENYRKQIYLDSKLIHDDILKKYKSSINIEVLTKYQRGTLIISNT